METLRLVLERGGVSGEERCVLKTLSRTMHRRVGRIANQCGRMGCGRVIKPGEEYYELGGGTVMTCAPCASARSFTIMIGRLPTTLQRGWDVPANNSKWLKLQRIMQ